MFSWEQFFFYLFAILLVFSSLMVILVRNPLSSAFFLVLSFINLSGLYVLLNAHFIAVAQVLVYGGAIMVLFIFVIMLLNLGREQKGFLDDWGKHQIPAILIGCLSLMGFTSLFLKSPFSVHSVKPIAPDFGTIQSVGMMMFSKYLIPFEIVGILLLVAAVGAVLLAKRVI